MGYSPAANGIHRSSFSKETLTVVIIGGERGVKDLKGYTLPGLVASKPYGSSAPRTKSFEEAVPADDLLLTHPPRVSNAQLISNLFCALRFKLSWIFRKSWCYRERVRTSHRW